MGGESVPERGRQPWERWPILFGLAAGLFVSGLDADSAGPLLLKGQKSVQLGKHVAILEDRSADLSISQVAAKEMAHRFPFNERTVGSRSPAYLLELARDEARTLFLRAETGSSMIVPLKLWSDVGYAEKSGIEMFPLGSFYGIGLILVAYNFFLLFSVKDFTYVYYIAYVVLLPFCSCRARRHQRFAILA